VALVFGFTPCSETGTLSYYNICQILYTLLIFSNKCICPLQSLNKFLQSWNIDLGIDSVPRPPQPLQFKLNTPSWRNIFYEQTCTSEKKYKPFEKSRFLNTLARKTTIHIHTTMLHTLHITTHLTNSVTIWPLLFSLSLSAVFSSSGCSFSQQLSVSQFNFTGSTHVPTARTAHRFIVEIMTGSSGHVCAQVYWRVGRGQSYLTSMRSDTILEYCRTWCVVFGLTGSCWESVFFFFRAVSEWVLRFFYYVMFP
jgi:hypothetical protein